MYVLTGYVLGRTIKGPILDPCISTDPLKNLYLLQRYLEEYNDPKEIQAEPFFGTEYSVNIQWILKEPLKNPCS